MRTDARNDYRRNAQMVERDLVFVFAFVALDQACTELGIERKPLMLPDFADVAIVGALVERVLECRPAPEQPIAVHPFDTDQTLVIVVLWVGAPVAGIGAGLDVPVIALWLALPSAGCGAPEE